MGNNIESTYFLGTKVAFENESGEQEIKCLEVEFKDILKTHAYIFQDFYDWAGEYRLKARSCLHGNKILWNC